MNFKHAEAEVEFKEQLHPEVRAMVVALDDWSAKGLRPAVTVVRVVGTKQEQEDFYWQAIMTKEHVSEMEAREKARGRFSWHLVRAAVDLRSRHYMPKELDAVVAYLKERCTAGPWELLVHDIGRGNHIHLARRDFDWRKEATQS